jgi:endonuclease/exonuclease/phosphatase family metal-dependent hydrolase
LVYVRILTMSLLLSLAPASFSAEELTVLSYNIYMRWPALLFRDDHDWRADRIPDHIRGYDVVVLQEAFAATQRDAILQALSDDYPYHSRQLGQNEILSHNGGVTILSRWPIRNQEQLVFDDCDGSDCLVKKGVVYTAIDWDGERVHVFGLHLQAQREYAPARIAQFPQLEEFIESRQIPSDELTLVAGDFNVDYYTDKIDGEFSQLTQSVGLALADENPEPTYDQASNTYAEETVTARLDYVFYSNRHLVPRSASNEVLHIRVEGHDLSDHHPVLGRFRVGAADE